MATSPRRLRCLGAKSRVDHEKVKREVREMQAKLRPLETVTLKCGHAALAMAGADHTALIESGDCEECRRIFGAA